MVCGTGPIPAGGSGLIEVPMCYGTQHPAQLSRSSTLSVNVCVWGV